MQWGWAEQTSGSTDRKERRRQQRCHCWTKRVERFRRQTVLQHWWKSTMQWGWTRQTSGSTGRKERRQQQRCHCWTKRVERCRRQTVLQHWQQSTMQWGWTRQTSGSTGRKERRRVFVPRDARLPSARVRVGDVCCSNGPMVAVFKAKQTVGRFVVNYMRGAYCVFLGVHGTPYMSNGCVLFHDGGCAEVAAPAACRSLMDRVWPETFVCPNNLKTEAGLAAVAVAVTLAFCIAVQHSFSIPPVFFSCIFSSKYCNYDDPLLCPREGSHAAISISSSNPVLVDFCLLFHRIRVAVCWRYHNHFSHRQPAKRHGFQQLRAGGSAVQDHRLRRSKHQRLECQP